MPFLDETGRFTEGLFESYRHGSEAHTALKYC
jgi:hypothetical protein